MRLKDIWKKFKWGFVAAGIYFSLVFIPYFVKQDVFFGLIKSDEIIMWLLFVPTAFVTSALGLDVGVYTFFLQLIVYFLAGLLVQFLWRKIRK
jgi:hypothetical protein